MMIATKAIECIHDETPCSTSYGVTKVINYATNPLPATFCVPCSLSHTLWFPLSFPCFKFTLSCIKSGCFDYRPKQQENMIIEGNCCAVVVPKTSSFWNGILMSIFVGVCSLFYTYIIFAFNGTHTHTLSQSMHDGCNTYTIKNLQFSLFRHTFCDWRSAKSKMEKGHSHTQYRAGQQIDGFSEIDNPESGISWASTILIRKTTTTTQKQEW